MRDYSPIDRPVSLGEIAESFGVTRATLARKAKRHGIRPAAHVGRMPIYGARQVRAFHAALTRGQSA